MENANLETERLSVRFSVTMKAGKQKNTETEAGGLKRKFFGVLAAVLLCMVCSACGKLTETEGTAVEKYKDYNGYGCYDQNGQLKYYLEIGDNVLLHCFFRSGSPEYEEVVYTLQRPQETAEGELTIGQIVDENGQDLSDDFSLLKFTFEPAQVLMQVERKEAQMAGGESDNITTGEYILVPIRELQDREQTVQTATMEGGELLAMARAAYEKETGFLAPEAECVDNGDGTYTIHLYEIVQGEDDWHTATSCWYTVNAFGEGTDDVMGSQIQLPGLSVAEVANYIPTPVKLTYSQEGEAASEWKITDAAIIQKCLEALQQITVGAQADSRAADAGETFCFTLADGSTWTVRFEAGRLLKGNIAYETEGYRELHNAVADYAAGTRQVAEAQDFTITPLYSGLELESYVCDDFSMEIPQGWVVESTQTIAGMQHAIHVYDPTCPVNQMLFILKAEPLYMDETMQYLFSTYGAEWGLFPVLNDVSTVGFFNVFSQYADAIETQPAYSTIHLPRIQEVSPMEGYGQGDSLVYADFWQNGTEGEGMFSVDLEPFNNPAMGTGYYMAYNVIAMTARKDTFQNWEEILTKSLSSLDYSQSFVNYAMGQSNQQVATSNQLSQAASEMSDSIMSSWENRNKSEDIMRQKQSDATFGVERVMDTETGEIYQTENGFTDWYDGERYRPITEDQYTEAVKGEFSWK